MISYIFPFFRSKEYAHIEREIGNKVSHEILPEKQIFETS